MTQLLWIGLGLGVLVLAGIVWIVWVMRQDERDCDDYYDAWHERARREKETKR